MAKILLEARDNVLIASTEGVITSDTISVPCSISFSDEWAQYGKTIFFYQNPRKMHRVVVAGQSADFEVPPQAIITGGELHIGVFGNYTDGEGNPQRKVAVATSVPAAKGSYSGTDLPKPSVSEYEQIISIMMAYMDAREVAEIAKEAAEQISTEAINAKAYITKTVDEATAEISDDVANAKNDLMEAANNATDQIATDASTVKGYVDEASAHAATAQTAAAASASARDESLAAINEALSARDEVVEVAEEALNEMGGYNAKVERNSKRATNAEDASTVKTPDSSVAYTKNVPANALPYAEITEIGGMTRKCTNLLPYPYDDTTKTTNGITFTDNGDGSITVNGTATADAVFNLSRVWIKAAQKYFASGCPRGGSQTSYYLLPRGFGKDTGNGVLINGTSSDFSSLSQIVVTSGTTVNNLVFKPMLNEGSTALPYEPYYEGLRSAPVSAVESVGVNMCPPFVKGVGLNFDNGNETVSATSATTDFIRIDLSEEEHLLSGMVETLPFLAACYDIGKNYLGRTGAVTGGAIALRQNLLARGIDLNALHYIRIATYENSVLGTGVISDFDNATPMLNEGFTALPYTPYFKRTLDIPEAVRAIDGYGWGVSEDIYNYIDYDKKQFVKRVGAVDMGTLTTWRGDTQFYYAQIPDLKPPVTASDRRNGILCAKYHPSSVVDITMLDNKGMVRKFDAATLQSQIFLKDEEYSTVASLKASLQGVMLYYELAEPIITDISDILPADNFIEVEGGGTVTMVNEYGYDVPSTVVYRVPKVGDDYVMISSPNGTVYKLTVSDSGSVSAVKT